MIDNTHTEIQKLKEENLLIKNMLDRAIEQLDQLMDHSITLAKTVNDHDKELAIMNNVNIRDKIKYSGMEFDKNDPDLEEIIKKDYKRLWDLTGTEDSLEVDHVRYEEMEENQAKILKLEGEDNDEA